jgi:antitoxin component of MazEF toxin-antitoxin module
MITARLRRSGNGFIVMIPNDDVERLGLSDGSLVCVEVRPVEVRPVLAADLREAFETEFKKGQDGLRYLAEN